MAREFINPTLIYSETDTLIAMDEAASAVEDQYVKKGDVLASAGTVVTEKLYGELAAAGAIRAAGDRVFMGVMISVFIGIFLFCIVGLIAVYLPRYLSSFSKALLSSLLIGTALVVAIISFRFNTVFNPIYLAAFMITMLVSGRVAAVSVLYLSLIFGLMCLGPNYEYAMFFRSLAMTLVGGFAGVLSVRKATRRSTVFTGALFASFVMSVALWTFSLIDSAADSELLFDMLRILGTNVLCAIVGIGIMPFWEWLFRLATPQRLAELSNANQPLLKRLMMEAPGTYHHSMLTASLAEAAATAIGANALCPGGRFYHDVGKLKRPIYFKENQRSGDNPDALEPEKSAAVLTAHVRDGVLMLQKAKMPGKSSALPRSITEAPSLRSSITTPSSGTGTRIFPKRRFDTPGRTRRPRNRRSFPSATPARPPSIRWTTPPRSRSARWSTRSSARRSRTASSTARR